MKFTQTARALAGVGLCGVGLWLALSVPYRPHTYRIDAGGCRLVTDIVEPSDQPPGAMPKGYVVLFHGLSANKRIMSYESAGFAAQGLRVFVPDLPGHGRSPGPFSYARSEECSANLLRELIARGALDPERTFLAGHSLGGAIALRVASHIPVAGVIAISPAPMHPIRGIPPEAIPFSGFGSLPVNSLVMMGGWESPWIRQGSQDLLANSKDATSQYAVIPHSTHISILFDPAAMSAAQNWVAGILHLDSKPALPSYRSLIGFFAGFVGILLLAGPFLRETLQSKKATAPIVESGVAIAKPRAFLECALVSIAAAAILSIWNPLRVLHLFEGGYFASYLLILGVALLLLHWNALRTLFGARPSDGQAGRPIFFSLLVAAFAAFLLHSLVTAWIDLTISEAWLTAVRWARFAPLFLAVLPYHAAEELILGPASPGKPGRRLFSALLLRFIAWLALVAAIFALHSGEILVVLLAPYFALFCLFQAWAMKVVREVTASPAATALFGAILLSGFCLVVFPTT